MEEEEEPIADGVERRHRIDDNDDDDDDKNDDDEWGSVLWDAILVQEAPLEEVRDLVLRQMPEAVRTRGVDVGATALRAALRLSGRRRRRDWHSPDRPQEEEEHEGRERTLEDPTLALIKFLVEEAGWGPQILTAADSNGYLALHLAILERCPPAIVKYLVRRAPRALEVEASTTDAERGPFPIHLAVDCPDDGYEMPQWGTVQCLLDAWPETIWHTSPEGWVPLHLAVRKLGRTRREHDRQVVRGLVNRCPESLEWATNDAYPQLPLHVAVTESVPVEDLQYLFEAYPDAIRIQTAEGFLPIHNAFVDADGSSRRRGVADLRTIRWLVQQDPTTLMERSSLGFLPLHLVFTNENGPHSEEAPPLDVVQFLVESCPESVREFGHNWTALLYAVANPRTCPEVIRCLVAAHPSSVHVREREGGERLALHVAIEWDLSVACIEALVLADPDTLQTRTLKGDLSLHTLLRQLGGPRTIWRRNRRHGTLLDVARCLVMYCPSSVRERTSAEGKMALHLALEMKQDASNDEEEDCAIIDYLLEQWPESVREYSTDPGWLPIHSAANFGRSPRVLRSLLNLWPDSVRQFTQGGDQQVFPILPIHAAAASESIPLPSLELLLDAWPDSGLEWSGEGWLPIHYAAGEQAEASTVQRLLELHPETIRSTTVDGFVPIHLAAYRPSRCGGSEEEVEDADSRRRTLEVIRLLVERDEPDALLTRVESDGSLPLHLALRSDVFDADVVNCLVANCPGAVRHRDNAGCLPLHVAVSRGDRDIPPGARDRLRSVVQTLVNCHPEALLVADSRGRLPFHVAAESGHASLDVLFVVLRRRPEAIRGGGGEPE